MFQLDEIQTTFEWPVKPRIPNAGSWKERVFTGTFHLLPQERVDEIINAYKADPDEIPDDLASEIFAGWKTQEVMGADNQPLEVSPENKAKLLGISYVRTAVVRAYFEAIGGKKVRLGN